MVDRVETVRKVWTFAETTSHVDRELMPVKCGTLKQWDGVCDDGWDGGNL